MRFQKLICASLWVKLLLVRSFVSAHAQEGMQGQLLEHGDKFPIVGATIVLTPGGTQDTLRSLTDERGVFTLPRALTYPLRLRASYFGESILDTLLTNPPSPPFVLYAEGEHNLGGVVVSASRRIVKYSPARNIIEIANIPLFRHDDLLEALGKIPGLLLTEQTQTYFSKPISGFRIGEHGTLRPISKDTKAFLSTLKAEDLQRISFKRVMTSYEIILDIKRIQGYALSVEAVYARSRKNQGRLRAVAQLNLRNWSNILTASERLSRGVEYSQERHITRGQPPFTTELQRETSASSLYLTYQSELSLGKKWLLGLDLNIWTGAEQVKSQLESQGRRSSMNRTYSDDFPDLNSGYYAAFSSGKHGVRAEIGYSYSAYR